MDIVGEAGFRRLSQGRASSTQGVPASPRASTQSRRPILISANNVEVAFPICLAYLKPSVSASEQAIENPIWPLFADRPRDLSHRCIPTWPHVAPHTAKIHALITLNTRNRARTDSRR